MLVDKKKDIRSITVLVTGGAGFIGSNLCRALLHDTSHIYHVICLDNFYCSSPENIAELREHPRFRFIHMDVNKCSVEEISTTQSVTHIDEIYHLACPASPPIYQKDPIHTINTNFIGTRNVLELARHYDASVLLASTSEVYGDPSIPEQDESYWGYVNSYGPRSCYDEGKRIAETLFLEYKNIHDVDTRIVRIFNTYGPYMNKDDGRVVSNLINQALENKPITLYGDGMQTRSFCYVSDLVSGLMKLMNSGYNDPVNLGNPNEMTIRDLASLILQLTESSSPLSFYELPRDDPKRRKPVISRAQILLDWSPVVSIEEGLCHTIQYYSGL